MVALRIVQINLIINFKTENLIFAQWRSVRTCMHVITSLIHSIVLSRNLAVLSFNSGTHWWMDIYFSVRKDRYVCGNFLKLLTVNWILQITQFWYINMFIIAYLGYFRDRFMRYVMRFSNTEKLKWQFFLNSEHWNINQFVFRVHLY